MYIYEFNCIHINQRQLQSSIVLRKSTSDSMYIHSTTLTKSPVDAFLRTHPRLTHDYIRVKNCYSLVFIIYK